MISDLMVFKMNAIGNGLVIESNDNQTINKDKSAQEVVTKSSISHTSEIILNIHKPSEQPKNVTNSKDTNQNDHVNITSTTATEKSTDMEQQVSTTHAPLIPEATVEPNIKHPVETQQKIIIRYASQCARTRIGL